MPRALHLFNVFGALTERVFLEYTLGLRQLGWDVTVYNHCGHKPLVDAGVTYRPFWDFNPRDKQDAVMVPGANFRTSEKSRSCVIRKRWAACAALHTSVSARPVNCSVRTVSTL